IVEVSTSGEVVFYLQHTENVSQPTIPLISCEYTKIESLQSMTFDGLLESLRSQTLSYLVSISFLGQDSKQFLTTLNNHIHESASTLKHLLGMVRFTSDVS